MKKTEKATKKTPAQLEQEAHETQALRERSYINATSIAEVSARGLFGTDAPTTDMITNTRFWTQEFATMIEDADTPAMATAILRRCKDFLPVGMCTSANELATAVFGLFERVAVAFDETGEPYGFFEGSSVDDNFKRMTRALEIAQLAFKAPDVDAVFDVYDQLFAEDVGLDEDE